MERVIAQQGVARLQRQHRASRHLLEQITHAVSHRTEAYGNMRCIGDQPTVGIKQRTGEIKPFADIHRATRLAKALPHLLSDRHEAMAK